MKLSIRVCNAYSNGIAYKRFHYSPERVRVEIATRLRWVSICTVSQARGAPRIWAASGWRACMAVCRVGLEGEAPPRYSDFFACLTATVCARHFSRWLLALTVKDKQRFTRQKIEQLKHGRQEET